jgi:hypothetical protein
LFNQGDLVSPGPDGPVNTDSEILGPRAAELVVNCPPMFVAPTESRATSSPADGCLDEKVWRNNRALRKTELSVTGKEGSDRMARKA